MIHSTAWRKSPERLSQAALVLGNPSTREMLAVLELDHPARARVAMKDGFDATLRVGLIDGFQLCLDMLRSLGEPLAAAPAEVRTTWGVPDEPTEKK